MTKLYFLAALALSLGGCSTDSDNTQSNGDAGQPPTTPCSTNCQTTPLGTSSLFAAVSNPPGYPEGIVVGGDRVFVSGPASFGTARSPASQILVFNRKTGAAESPITITGEVIETIHSLSCITVDPEGRLYVLSTQLGVLRLTPSGGGFTQETYSPLPPNLAPCPPNPTSACSPTIFDGPPLPNDLAFDEDGSLYITDSLQATIWKVAPGGGPPSIWFQSPDFASTPLGIGPNGIRLTPDRKNLYFTVTARDDGADVGRLYSLPRGEAPSNSDLKVLHTFSPGESPDGIAFGANGKLYVAIAGKNAVSVLAPDGSETARYTASGSSIPFDGPANIAFDGEGNLLITNHAVLSNNVGNFAVIRMFVDDLGSPLAMPNLP